MVNYDLHLYSANLHVIMIKFALHQVLRLIYKYILFKRLFNIE